jgi:acyl carrier protein
MQTSETEITPGISEYGIMSRIRDFVEERSLVVPYDFALADDETPLERGVADSEGVAQLIAFIESEFGVFVSKQEINETNLGSLRAAARFVAAKQPFAVG